jgi:hypothetical protein
MEEGREMRFGPMDDAKTWVWLGIGTAVAVILLIAFYAS